MSTARASSSLHGAHLRRLVQEPAHFRRKEDRAHQLVQGLLREEGPSGHPQVDWRNRSLISIIFPRPVTVVI